MNTFQATVPQLIQMLNNLDHCLEAGIAFAKKKSFDPDVLLTARLAPDQYPLSRQIQVACDSAKFAAARLAGKQAPPHPDTEKTMDEHRSRIRTCVAYLETITSADFDGADERRVSLPFMEGKWLHGHDYLVQFALPNFYFHVTSAYAILRHNGVAIGKMDFIGSVSFQDAPAA
jgi:hypothetical protein